MPSPSLLQRLKERKLVQWGLAFSGRRKQRVRHQIHRWTVLSGVTTPDPDGRRV